MVKLGYKQTEIGVIPEEWMCKEIGSFANVCMCKRIFVEQTSDMGEIPFYKIGTFGKKADAYIPRALFEEYKRTYSYPKKGDVLISAAGTLGRTVVYDGEEAYFQDSNIVWLDIDKSQISNDYLYHYYKVIKWTPSEGSTIARLYNGIITSTNVAVPPKPEQAAIAEALSDIDTLIVNLEKLIAKKKAIKQGAMQELLTGKRRLPGFSEKWMEHTLGDFVECIRGVSYDGSADLSQYETAATVRLLRSNNIKNARFVDADVQYVFRNKVKTPQRLCVDDIMVCMANGSRSLVGKSCFFGKPFVCDYTFGAFMSCLRKKEPDTNMYYIFNLMNSDSYWNQIAILFSGSSINNLRPTDILNMRFPFPLLSEQAAICEVIRDMENEILDLERKLYKYQGIMLGMMSELLTGRIRLIDKEDA